MNTERIEIACNKIDMIMATLGYRGRVTRGFVNGGKVVCLWEQDASPTLEPATRPSYDPIHFVKLLSANFGSVEVEATGNQLIIAIPYYRVRTW